MQKQNKKKGWMSTPVMGAGKLSGAALRTTKNNKGKGTFKKFANKGQMITECPVTKPEVIGLTKRTPKVI